MIRRPPRSTLSSSSAASDVYKRQLLPDGGVCRRWHSRRRLVIDSSGSAHTDRNIFHLSIRFGSAALGGRTAEEELASFRTRGPTAGGGCTGAAGVPLPASRACRHGAPGAQARADTRGDDRPVGG